MKWTGTPLIVSSLLLALFILSAPWHFAGREEGRLSIGLALFALPLVLAAVFSACFREAVLRVLRSDKPVSPRLLRALALACIAFCVWTTASKFLSFEVNAWDFSLYFDRPLERTLHGQILYSDFLGSSTLAAHSDLALLLFIPLYSIHASPWWLVIGQGAIVAAATMAAFRLFRNLTEDTFASVTLAAAFLLNKYTAKCLQYVFHIETLYLLSLFLLLLALKEKRPFLFSSALLLTMAIKQDAVIPLFGITIIALLLRRFRYAAAACFGGLTGFLLDYFVLMPHFAANAAHPWYSWYWASFGPTPLRAALGIIGKPMLVITKLSHSAVGNLLGSVLLLPLVGFEWLAAALPGLILYGCSDFEKLAHLDLYYSAAVLPLLFASAAVGICRVADRAQVEQRRFRLRVLSIVFLIWSHVYGSGYHFAAWRSDGRALSEIRNSVPAGAEVRIQGALFPHAGYDPRWRVLERTPPGLGEAVMLDEALNPYPLSRAEMASLIRKLRLDPSYTEVRREEIALFIPRR